MSDKNQILPEEETNVKTENKARTIMMWCSIVVAIVVIGVLCYIYLYKQPAVQKANEAIGEADRIAMFENNDSTALAAYEAVANDYGFDAGNRAKLEAAIMLYQQGDYQKALDYVSKYDNTDDVIAPLALGLKGDCLVNLDRNADAVKAFKKAISQSDNNPQLVPYFLQKLATIYSAEGNYAEAVKSYKEIENKYPYYAQRAAIEGLRIQAEALQGK
ncbi:MAG: tetratricopeptide repeat protein [Bacteroides sp.]|nr:tetratricopeptide repeat protein [Bacteroides sp.]MCM1380076.1 tetratricopeptide repeat protein [Bacteroides sp.]MCM1446413.1 tetratricopeptide repeat protein [Prevotella sp.]